MVAAEMAAERAAVAVMVVEATMAGKLVAGERVTGEQAQPA